MRYVSYHLVQFVTISKCDNIHNKECDVFSFQSGSV